MRGSFNVVNLHDCPEVQRGAQMSFVGLQPRCFCPKSLILDMIFTQVKKVTRPQDSPSNLGQATQKKLDRHERQGLFWCRHLALMITFHLCANGRSVLNLAFSIRCDSKSCTPPFVQRKIQIAQEDSSTPCLAHHWQQRQTIPELRSHYVTVPAAR